MTTTCLINLENRQKIYVYIFLLMLAIIVPKDMNLLNLTVKQILCSHFYQIKTANTSGSVRITDQQEGSALFPQLYYPLFLPRNTWNSF